MLGRSLSRLIRPAVGLVVIALALNVAFGHSGDLIAQPATFQVGIGATEIAMVLVLAGYAAGAAGLASITLGWREGLRAGNALRLWVRVNLLGYLSERVALARGIALAERIGVSKDTSAGAVLFPGLVYLAIAGAAGLAFSAATFWYTSPIVLGTVEVGAVVLFLAPLLLAKPMPVWRLGMRVQHPDSMQPIEPESLAGAMVANLLACGAFGLALSLLADGLLAADGLKWPAAIGVAAVAEATGIAFPVLPAGLGVRDGMVFVLLRAYIGFGPAIVLMLAWRLVRTAADVAATIPFLVIPFRAHESADATSPVELTSVQHFPAPHPDAARRLGAAPPAVALVRDGVAPAAEPADQAAQERRAFAAWQAKHAGVADLQRRVRELEAENAKLKRLYAELALHHTAPGDGHRRRRS